MPRIVAVYINQYSLPAVIHEPKSQQKQAREKLTERTFIYNLNHLHLEAAIAFI